MKRRTFSMLFVFCMALSLVWQARAAEQLYKNAEIVPQRALLKSGKVELFRNLPRKSLLRQPRTATITVNYTGFSTEQQAAFEYAKSIWEKSISSSVTITINAKWENLGTGILGSCGPTNFYKDFTNATVSGTYYPVALAEAIAGTDLNGGDAEIQTQYNTLYADSYYYGTDGNCPANKTDYVSVALHEICHGLGFISLCGISNGQGYYGQSSGFPSIMGRGYQDANGNKVIDYTSATDLATLFTSGALYFNGTNTGTVQMYAPSTYSGGSSIDHLDEIYNGTANALMTYSIGNGEVEHSLGTIVPNMFKDMGWTIDGGTDPAIDVSSNTLSVVVKTGSDANNSTFEVYNSGTGTLNFTISDDVDWLACTPTSGDSTASTDKDTITVSYSTSTLAANTYTGTITIADADGKATSQTVAVTLTVSDNPSATPTISLSTSTLTASCDQGSDATSTTFSVDNTGDSASTLSYSISDNATWLSCSPSSGTVTAKVAKTPINRGVRYTGPLPLAVLRTSGKTELRRLLATPKMRNKAKTATINVTYTGYTDEQKAAFEYAKAIWEKSITSSVAININTEWKQLGTGILGQAGPTGFYKDFTNAPKASTYYCVALAESLAGTDLNNGGYEIETAYNTDYSNVYYYGTDGNCPANKTDYVSVVIHEICHGLGFTKLMTIYNGEGIYGLALNDLTPSVFDLHYYNSNGQQLTDTSIFSNPSSELGTQITTPSNVFFKGTNAGTVEIYSPSTWAGGSSLSHVAESYNGTNDALMTYSIGEGEVQHTLGTVVPNIFKDIGWTAEGGGGGGGTGDTITVTYDTDALSAGTHTATISVTDANASNTPQTITVTLTVTGSGYNVSIGSQFDVDASLCTTAGISSFEKKPKIYVLNGRKKGTVKVLTKSYPADTVTCEWKKPMDANTYPLYCQPKGKGVKYDAEKISDSFVVKPPDITAMSASAIGTKITKKGTFYDVKVELTGTYFGSKKAKVYFEYDDAKGRTKKKNFKMTEQTFNITTGASTYTGVAKKVPADTSGYVVLENKIAEDYEQLTTTITGISKLTN